MEFSFSEFTDPNPGEIYSFKLSSPQPIIIPINQIVNCFQSFIDTGSSPKSIAKATQLDANRRNIIVNDITIITNSGDKMLGYTTGHLYLPRPSGPGNSVPKCRDHNKPQRSNSISCSR
jgi:hypothetical protein